MKIRTDFVSNSSSSSFICCLNKKVDTDKYCALFDTLLKESTKSPKLFEHVVIDLDVIKDPDLMTRIRACSVENDFGNNLLQTFNWEHDLKLDEAKHAILSFPEYLFMYMQCDKKDLLKSAIVMFISESTWDNNEWDHEEYFDELQSFLNECGINYETETASV